MVCTILLYLCVLEFNYIYWVRSFGFDDVHFIVRLCHRYVDTLVFTSFHTTAVQCIAMFTSPWRLSNHNYHSECGETDRGNCSYDNHNMAEVEIGKIVFC
jgi:hypothetical protein